jgi:two-component system, sensor histidine kinase and response regulator
LTRRPGIFRGRSRFSQPAPAEAGERNGGGVSTALEVPPDLAAELRASEERYLGVVESAGDGIVSANELGVITSFNAAAERIFGYTREEAVGRPLTALMPERFHEAHKAGLNRFLATREPRLIGGTVEVTGLRKDGGEFPLELTLTSWESGGLTFFTGVMRDTSDRKRVQQYFATERAVLQVLTSSSGPHEALLGALEALAEGTGSEVGGVWTINDRQVLECAAFWRAAGVEVPEFHALSRRTTFEPGVGLPGRVWQRRTPVWIEDVQLDTNFPRMPAAVENGLHGAIALPLASGTEFIGVLELFSRKTRTPDEELLRMLLVIGREVGNYLDRSRADEAIRELATMVECAGDAIIGKTRDGVITSWNPAAERLYGYTAEEAVGQPISIVLPPGVHDEAPAFLERVSRGERVEAYETVRCRKDGSEVDVSLTIAPTANQNGHGTAAAVIARDISDKKRAERELAAAAAELERSNAELERFGSIIAHDLFEPLRVISGFAGLVRSRYGDQLEEEGNRFLDLIGDATTRMEKLIDDLLAYARVGRGTSRGPVECGDVVEQVLASLAIRLDESSATVQVEPLPTVHGDASQLGQLFQNLIGNALKFVGDAPPKVRVHAEREDGGWRFSVEDNGPGVDPDNAERIFEAFQRLESRDVPGTGIGLAICKRIVELHGGRIWVEALPNGGSAFRFTIAGPSP